MIILNRTQPSQCSSNLVNTNDYAQQTGNLSKTEVNYYQYKSHNERERRILSEHRLHADSPVSSAPCNSASSLPTCTSSNHPSAARSSPSRLCLNPLQFMYDRASPRDAPPHRCSFAWCSECRLDFRSAAHSCPDCSMADRTDGASPGFPCLPFRIQHKIYQNEQTRRDEQLLRELSSIYRGNRMNDPHSVLFSLCT